MMVRTLPLIWAIAFAGIGFVGRAWLHHRRFGYSGLMLFRSGCWNQHLREALLLALSAVICGQAVIYALRPASLDPLFIVTPPTTGVSVALGALLLFGGTALMVAAQLDMGASWRVGLDEGRRPGLVTTGLYRFSRNPIYLALFVALAGLMLLLPTWLTLAVFTATLAGVRNQVVEEERYLRRTYGGAFDAYAKRVGRFVPGLGTLAD